MKKNKVFYNIEICPGKDDYNYQLYTYKMMRTLVPKLLNQYKRVVVVKCVEVDRKTIKRGKV